MAAPIQVVSGPAGPVPASPWPPRDPFVFRPRSFHWRWNPLWRLVQRVRLSAAKHPSLGGHPRIALRLARLLPEYTYAREIAFGVDGAPSAVVAERRAAFAELAATLRARSPRSLAAGRHLATRVSDLAFVNGRRVPFQFAPLAAELEVPTVAARTDGPRVQDLDGNWSYDLSGSYGVNLLGSDFYKATIAEAVHEAGALGMILGPYHPVLGEVCERLCAISGLDEVSFHMSGTEAVMQAVRLARFHTGRRHVVRFVGAYHGWSDGVQAGPGNPLPARDVLTLPELRASTLRILASHDDIACVLVNPIQAMHPNGPPPTDATLVTGTRGGTYDKAAYAAWLADLAAVCRRRGIVLVFDEVFLGFRLARGGAQEFFGVRADLVTYGKTLGGGLPVGVLCGRQELMARSKPGRPADICFARGTFNCHPYVVTAMAAFLRRLDTPEVQATYEQLEQRWDGRAAALNVRLAAAGVPVRVSNLVSVFSTRFTRPGRYHWMFQYYLRAHGLWPAWTGTGRFILGHDLSDEDLRVIAERFVAAATHMRDDGWFWRDPSITDAELVTRTRRTVLRETLRAAFRNPFRTAAR